MFAGGLDFSSPVKKFFYDPLGSGKNFVDCVVSLTGVVTKQSTKQCGLLPLASRAVAGQVIWNTMVKTACA